MVSLPDQSKAEKGIFSATATCDRHEPRNSWSTQATQAAEKLALSKFQAWKEAHFPDNDLPVLTLERAVEIVGEDQCTAKLTLTLVQEN